MNDPQEPLPDQLLDEMVAPLRAVELPDDAHPANMAAVHRALEARVQPRWWRRTVTVPIPVAIAATLALAFTTAALLRPPLVPKRIDREPRGPTKVESVGTGTVPDFGADHAAGSAWSVSRSYIRSLESLANLRVSLTTDAAEKRDDY